MSNTRKARRPDDNRDRERRHMAWLSLPGNGDSLAAASAAAYERDGRGLWFACDGDGDIWGGPGITRTYYVPAADIAVFPAGGNRDMVARMVATYDPARQMVVVIEEDHIISAYKVRLIRFADPALN